MASIRVRLTLGYSAALLGTLVVFAGALWVERRAGAYQDLAQEMAMRANGALTILRQARLAGQPVIVRRDSLVALAPALRTQLGVFEDDMLVFDTTGLLVYASPAFTRLSGDDRNSLRDAARRWPTEGAALVFTLGEDRFVLVARRDPEGVPEVSRVVAAASARSAEIAPRELFGTMFVIVPFIVLVSVGAAYLIAGRAFRPVDRIIDEVAAISDGRSLHRRLPLEEDSEDELSRLTATLNAMLTRLEGSFGALRRFTADASHELKTPLAVLRADVERAMNASSHSTEQLVALEEALAEITRMADLVDSLLTLARADEGRYDLHREPVHLEPLVREVFETAAILGEGAGLSVALPVLEDAVVAGDGPRLRQLFLNLVTNAIKYTPRGGSVELSLARQGREVSFAVRDSGIGIASADLPHIFERFWRADRVRSRAAERGGFGLGLAISQWIAQAHGGTLTVQSRLGRGSTFTVLLPILEAGPVTAAPAAAPAGERGGVREGVSAGGAASAEVPPAASGTAAASPGDER